MESSAAEQRYIVYGEDISKMYLWKGGEWGEPSVRYDEPSVKSGISLALTHIPRNALPHFNEETRPWQTTSNGKASRTRSRVRPRRPVASFATLSATRPTTGASSSGGRPASSRERLSGRSARPKRTSIPTPEHSDSSTCKRGGRQAAP